MNASRPPHLTPLPPEQWDDQILDSLGAFPSSLNFVMSKWQEKSSDQRGRSILGFLAHYPKLAKAFLTLNKHVAADTLLTTRDKELLILRCTWLREADNEFAQHIILGKRAGLSDDDIERVTYGAEATGWQDADRELLVAADELVNNNKLSSTTFELLSKRFSHQEIMDIIFLVGSYSVLSSAVESFGIPLDQGLAGHDPQIPEFLEHWRQRR